MDKDLQTGQNTSVSPCEMLGPEVLVQKIPLCNTRNWWWMEEVKAGDDASAIPLLLPLSPTPPPPPPPASCVEGSFNSSTPCFLPVTIDLVSPLVTVLPSCLFNVLAPGAT